MLFILGYRIWIGLLSGCMLLSWIAQVEQVELSLNTDVHNISKCFKVIEVELVFMVRWEVTLEDWDIVAGAASDHTKRHGGLNLNPFGFELSSN